ncbi:poly-gamma-glutamate hydrolase family protein [Streptomyces sp. ISL-43]|nr:poly-gamma-glutamate hydrolase family protein [Streptomyces sp. ISL-43]
MDLVSPPGASGIPATSRRTLLTALAAATAGAPLLAQFGGTPAYAATTPPPCGPPAEGQEYESNNHLYCHLAGREGIDFARRYKRHQLSDTSLPNTFPYARTTIMALHGGGIEMGTSELCLGIAGYDPGKPDGEAVCPTTYDYWMFEGLRSASAPVGQKNGDLHVTAKNCDDHVALSMAASSLNVLSLHGCKADQIPFVTNLIWPPKEIDPKAVVVGGLFTPLREALVAELRASGFQAIDAMKPEESGVGSLGHLNGDHENNPCNKTMLRQGAQMELTTELRASLFGDFTTRGGRATTWDNRDPRYSEARFIPFRDACRRAIAAVEATQPIL